MDSPTPLQHPVDAVLGTQPLSYCRSTPAAAQAAVVGASSGLRLCVLVPYALLTSLHA